MDAWSGRADWAAGRAETLFRAELRPHRSVGLGSIHLLIGLLVGLFVPTAAAFTLAGAWPVSGFMGFELALLYACFRVNLRRGAAVELIDVSRERLTVERVDHWGGRQRWTLQPQWARVELKALSPARGRLELHARGKALSIGGFLTLAEQGELARALRDALGRARAADFSAVKPA